MTRAQDPRPSSTHTGLVGALIGTEFVKARVKPGRHVLYVLHDTESGRERLARGYRVVRAARAVSARGGVVIMPRTPWRDESADVSATSWPGAC